MTSKRQKGPKANIAKGSANPARPETCPDEIPARLKEDVCRWKRDIDKHRDFFLEKGINPFREAHEILLSFLNHFDTLAGMKAK